MGIVKVTQPAVTATTFECDKCGFASTNSTERGGYAEVRASIDGVGYDGGTGGKDVTAWLCGSCSTAFERWLSN